MMETISAEVGVEVGDTLLMACNKQMKYKITGDDGTTLMVEDPQKEMYAIQHTSLHLYLVIVK